MKKLTFLFLFAFIAGSAFAMGTPPKTVDDGNFSLNDLSGRPVALDSFKGHLVLVAFFTTSCPACQDEMPQLQTLYDRYRSREFYVVGVNIGSGADDVKTFANYYKLNFPILLDEDGAVSKQYKVRYIPRLFIFDKNGKVIYDAQYVPLELIEKEVVKDLQ